MGDDNRLHGTTEEPSRELSAAVEKARLPGLTVLYHPDLSQVGHRAVLTGLAAGQTLELSRLVPAFGDPTARVEPAPLAHRRLSRQPLRLVSAGDDLVLRRAGVRTDVLVDAEPLAAERRLTPAEIESGAVLVLGDRVVLLLHLLEPVLDPELPRFGLIGESPGVIALRRSIRQVADLPVSVLLRGETGTGKELAAKALHRASRRREGPFVAVNMAAIPPSLAAAELFGAARGAFTGADRKRLGYFARAHRGTLFLDEVGDTPAEIQTLLLRCLETGEIQPVGGELPRTVDVRLVAATDAELEAAVAEKRFRAPLLHRLSGFQISLPPLRERREDCGRLLLEFLRQELEAVGKSHRLAADPPWLPARLVARMADLAWPGNVRQLRNVVRQLVITHHDRRQVVPDAAVEALFEGAAPASPAASMDGSPRPRELRPGAEGPRKPADISEAELLAALAAQRWRPYAAARQLGIPRPSIYHLMRKSPRIRTAAELGPEDIEPVMERWGDDVAAMAAALEVSERALRRRLRQLGLSAAH